MKYRAIAALLSFGLHVQAVSVHLDVSDDGDIALDVGMKPKLASPLERGQSSPPVYPSRHAAKVLEEYQVDLDYEVHAGTLSENGKYLKFKNIPYAEPPLGDLRFFEPTVVMSSNETVNYGWNENVCPQVQAGWAPKAMDFLTDFENPSALANWTDPVTPADYGPVQYPPKPVGEDCLTLDVLVPKTVWDKKNEREICKPAVIVWVHGGGFGSGWKDQHGSPEGLFDAASNVNEQNIVYDAGASSIMHHITAPLYHKPTMSAAIIQSPAFFPQPDVKPNDEMYAKFLKLANVKNLEALFTADTKTLQDANAKLVHDSKYGYFSFGPTIDNRYVRDLPGKILAQPSDELFLPPMLLGNERRDGLLFTPPWIRTTEYEFNALPAVHGYDTGYTFYPSAPLFSHVDEQLAKFFQRAIVDFVRYKDPNLEDVETWETYPTNRNVMNMGKPDQVKPDYSTIFGSDLMDRARCEYWQSAPFSTTAGGEGSDRRIVVQDGAPHAYTEEL
ncbi:hypothetical protein G7Y79_00004g015560 [Physcia stellaris]|nr:hypothetical protein G7Y79_00004g015560 [Physcia stellaris]